MKIINALKMAWVGFAHEMGWNYRVVIHGASFTRSTVKLEGALFYQKYSRWHPIKRYKQRKYVKKVLTTSGLEGKGYNA